MDADEIWARAFTIVRRDVDVPTVWLAMQAVKPLVLEGNRFVAALPSDQQYLAMNLESAEYAMAIEDALNQVTGHPIAFHLIEGETLADWEMQKALPGGATRPASMPGYGGFDHGRPEPAPGPRPAAAATAAPPPPTQAAPAAQETPAPSAAAPKAPPLQTDYVGDITSWEKLNEKIVLDARTFPLKFPHGQAIFLLHAVKLISQAMDLLLPADGRYDITMDRALNKSIERLGMIVGNLDPLFVSLELMRYRQGQGKL